MTNGSVCILLHYGPLSSRTATCGASHADDGCNTGLSFAQLSMNSENQVAVLEQIFPAQGEQRGQEPQLPTSYSGSHPDLDTGTPLQRAASAPFEKVI